MKSVYGKIFFRDSVQEKINLKVAEELDDVVEEAVSSDVIVGVQFTFTTAVRMNSEEQLRWFLYSKT